MAGAPSKRPTVPSPKTLAARTAAQSATEVEPEECHFGRYQLGFRLAAGGMASVYLGRMVSTGGFFKPVVVKRMHPHLSDNSDYVAMFRDEAQITARIAHANVCPLVDFGQIDGKWFMALEYLPGVPLSRVIGYSRKNPENINTEAWRGVATRAIAETAEGLHAAHELSDDRGCPLDVVHRDVSPQNILVGTDGTARILDFGVATSRGRLHQTASGVVKGKFSYMAPEEISDKPVDRRVDVWALGVCLWEALTGRRLFKGADLNATVKKIEKGPIPAPSKLSAGVPEALDAVVLKALAREPEERYQTARDLASALRGVLVEMGGVDSSHATAAWLAKHCKPEIERQRRLVLDLAEREDMDEVTVIEYSMHEAEAYVPGRDDVKGPQDKPVVQGAAASGVHSPLNAPSLNPEMTNAMAQTMIATADIPLSVISGAAARWVLRRVPSSLMMALVGLMIGLAPYFYNAEGTELANQEAAMGQPAAQTQAASPAAHDDFGKNPVRNPAAPAPRVVAAPATAAAAASSGADPAAERAPARRRRVQAPAAAAAPAAPDTAQAAAAAPRRRPNRAPSAPQGSLPNNPF